MAIGQYMSEGQLFAHISNQYHDRYFTKLHDGASIGALVLSPSGYITPIMVSRSPEGASCYCTDLRRSEFSREFTLGNGVDLYIINGENYYCMYEWGLPNATPSEFDIDGSNKSTEAIIRELLGLQPLDNRIIIVKWARPTDGKILTDTFNVTVDVSENSDGDIEHEYTGPQE